MIDGKQPLPSDAEDGALKPREEPEREAPQEDDKRVEEDPSEQPS